MGAHPTVTQSGNTFQTWEGTNTWPYVNKVFNVYAFDYPEKRFSKDTQAPYRRAQGYPTEALMSSYPERNFLRRSSPQLTWFNATYDVLTEGGKCPYPKIAGPMKDGKRLCMEPGKLSAADEAALRAQQEKAEQAFLDAVTASLAAQSVPKWECTAKYQAASGDSYVGRRATISGKEYVVYTKLLPDRRTEFYDCATNKLLYTQAPERLTGLGETEVEKAAISKQKMGYRTTELMLLGAVAAGLFLVWRK
jgi:hypothetical protein